MEYMILTLLVVIAVMIAVVIVMFSLKKTENNLPEIEKSIRDENSRLRTEIDKKIGLLENSFITRLENSSANQSKQLNEITQTNNELVKNLTQSVENKLNSLSEKNEKKLEEMRKTVDEKLFAKSA